jgi:predicted metalloprotease with PDZ domain
MQRFSRPRLALSTLALLAAGGAPLAAQRTAGDSSVSAPVSDMRYEVTVDATALATRRLRVATSFTVSGAGPVVLSLPAWTPGAYEISNFANRVIGFAATQSGAALRWDKLDFDSWRVRPTGAGRVTLSFEFLADTLDNAMAWTRPDFALFNGTNLFLYPEGRPKEFAATVVIRPEAGFRIATSMPWAGSANTYRASNYHDLVDMPVFVGRFDLDSATISGKTVRYATYPMGTVAGSARSQAWDQLKRLIPVEVLVFGEVPWDSYSLLQIADSSYGGYSGLEHSSSHVDIVSPAFIGSDFQPSLYAHEIFHAWNVKRLRPAEMVPYQYDRPQPTPWLWVSEGITDYYADLSEVRGGVIEASGFYALTSGKIAEIENTVPFALEDASVNTWVHPKDGTEYSYYPKGSLAGLLLDVSIRDASDNRASLDQVMRELYQTTYKRGRGFTYDDFWGAVRRAANGRSFDDFARRYVDGREPFPWTEAFRTIGLRFEHDSVPRLGITTSGNPTGAVQVTEVAPGGAGAQAGVRTGDLLLRVGDTEVSDPNFGVKFRAAYTGKPGGTPLPIVVRRGAESLTLNGRLMYAPGPPHIVEDPGAPARALRLRNGILRGVVDR